jgi:16S rRNA processing protein RimM
MSRPRKSKAPVIAPPPERRLVVCVIGAPHGVRGEARVKSFTGDPMALADYGALFSADGVAFEIERGRWLKDDMLVLKFASMDDRDQVAKFTGTELFVDRANLPEPDEEDEFYHADLIGLDVVDLAGGAIGTVHGLQNFGAGDILEIRPAGGGPTWLQPFTKLAVPNVDIVARRVVIDPAHLAKPEPHQERPDFEARKKAKSREKAKSAENAENGD